jgi:hypothetical protein
MRKKRAKDCEPFTPEEIIASSIQDPVSGCWEWQHSMSKWGYGMVRRNGRNMHSHRASYIAFNGPIPSGMVICHKCDNRKCVNPDHLFVGTQKENLADARMKGRMFDPPQRRGEQNNKSKLSEADVAKIRSMVSCGIGKTAIGRMFGIHRETVRRAAEGRTWAHIAIGVA